MNKDTLKVRGVFELRVIEKATGNVVHEYRDNNLVVDLCRTNVVKLLGGDAAGHAITKIGVGTSNTPPAAGDTALTGAFTKNLNTGPGQMTTYGTNTVTFQYQIDTTEANGMGIWEFGLFNSANALMARKVLSTIINKTNSFALQGSWTLTVN